MPHMGNIYVPFKTLFRELNIEMVVPPSNSSRSLSLGVKYSPEFVCVPFKLTLGNFIEALEMGADTLIMAAGPGLCRFGYYARIQEQILHDQGYKFQMIANEIFEGKIFGVINMLKRMSGASMPSVISAVRFGLSKLSTLDDIEREVHKIRAREIEKGASTRVYKEAIEAVDVASSSKELKSTKILYIDKLHSIPSHTTYDPLVVGITGEFYVVLEPFSNMDVEIELGKLGVEVRRSTFVSDWTKFSLFLNAFGVSEKDKIHKAASPYLTRDVGGDGWETVGEIVLHSDGYDGMIHLAPFTCMPEIIAQNIMPSIKEDLPVLTITCDEQMGRAGLVTRLEAFVDLLRRRKGKREPVLGARVR